MKRYKKFALLMMLFAVSTTTYSRNIERIDPDPEQDTTLCDRKEFSKDYNKTFDLSKNTLVILANKYGKIDVKTGSGNQAIVNVKITAHANTQAEADKVFDRINIAFSSGPDFVKAETDIEPQNGKWFGNWGNNSCEYSIDYDVTMPAANKLDLSNKYGNSYIGALTDWVKIDQKYGDFKLEAAGSATVSLAYGGGTIGKMNGLTGTISYGKLSSADIKDVSLKSKYSAFKFDKIANLALVSAYDDYDVNTVTNLAVDCKYGDIKIGTVENLAAKASYTDFIIKKIETSADFETGYGNVKIGSVKNSFGVINIKSSYTDYQITIDPSVSYQLDAKGTYSDIKHPVTIKTQLDSEKGSSKEIIGTVGDGNTKSLIKARMTYGDLRLR
jgi:Putative adhesin